MKIILDNGKYKVHTAQRKYVDVLGVCSVLTDEDISIIAEETNYRTFKRIVKGCLDNHAYRYSLEKVCNILADGVFTLKRDRTITLSRRGSSFNRRLTRMINNYELAQRLGIECHLKNKLLENERANNQAEFLGL